MNNIRYDKIGENYNRTRKADPYIFQRLFELLQTKEDGHYLDIGCGTGNYTALFAEQGLMMSGMDPSSEMLKKAEENQPDILWLQGQAEKTGLPKNEFDGIVGSLTIHHWNNLLEGFKELYSILKPQSKLVLFTSDPQQMEGYWLNHYFPSMMKASMALMPELPLIKQALLAARFSNFVSETYSVQEDLKDHFLYVGKYRPELYLNPEIRNGISSFSLSTHQSEVHRGLKELEKDIENKTIEKIVKQFENHNGDYLFITADKN